jgi:arsenate reductase (thioredoxin)
MAEGFFNQEYVPRNYRAISAGTRPSSQINPLAVQAMKEAGIDISNQKSKLITEDVIKSLSKSVDMGCIESRMSSGIHKQCCSLGHLGSKKQVYREG